MKKCLIFIIFIVTLLTGHAFYIQEANYLIGAPDDTIELHTITPAIFEG